MKTTTVLCLVVAFVSAASATQYFVAPTGNDSNPGTRKFPLRTIQRGADLAQPGDVVTVRQGVYRERINPPRGGTSTNRRIVYQAAPGERVEIKGSELVKKWEKVQEGVWKVSLPNSFFGPFNPYGDLIRGDWFNPKGRQHHTGAVYINGDWLVEAAKLTEVLAPDGAIPSWLTEEETGYLLNVAWMRALGPGTPRAPVQAASYATQRGIQKAACSEGGECIGWIDNGDWARYEQVDFVERTDELEIRAASATAGGIIRIRLDNPDGELLGTCKIPNTGGWQSWASFKVKIKPMTGRRTICFAFSTLEKSNPIELPQSPGLWFAQVDETNTTIWAQFSRLNPNEQQVEINVRRTVFYPDQPGRNFITVRGFRMSQAATPWAPPTAEQVGLIGTHWSKGWIIENNVISHSTCSGVSLGKYGDQWDNTSADTAEGYVKTIERALQNGWNRQTIGHHIVRNNEISHCEQTGIVGSLGAAFSTVSGNSIHDIHVRHLFTGAEMAGIKFHAAIDTVIRGNHIYRTCRGLWLDWMAQGTRVSGNLFHNNASEDVFVEVDHGPFLMDNNLLLSPVSLLDMSEGGAYAHNLFAGKTISRPEPSRQTPYHPAHSTAVAGLVDIKGGDDRFYNNLLIGPTRAESSAEQRKSLSDSNTPNSPVLRADPQGAGGYGLWIYDFRPLPLRTGGNVYYGTARPYVKEGCLAATVETNPSLSLVENENQFTLHLTLGPELEITDTQLVSTAVLGDTAVARVAYENADSSPLKIDRDYFGKPRRKSHPTPGPFERPGQGHLTLRIR